MSKFDYFLIRTRNRLLASILDQTVIGKPATGWQLVRCYMLDGMHKIMKIKGIETDEHL